MFCKLSYRNGRGGKHLQDVYYSKTSVLYDVFCLEHKFGGGFMQCNALFTLFYYVKSVLLHYVTGQIKGIFRYTYDVTVRTNIFIMPCGRSYRS